MREHMNSWRRASHTDGLARTELTGIDMKKMTRGTDNHAAGAGQLRSELLPELLAHV